VVKIQVTQIHHGYNGLIRIIYTFYKTEVALLIIVSDLIQD